MALDFSVVSVVSVVRIRLNEVQRGQAEEDQHHR